MLPLPPCLPLQCVNRSRLELEGDRLLANARRIAPEPHAAAAKQRYSNHSFELRDVAMPTELRPWRVFRDQRVREILCFTANPRGGLRAQRVKESGNGISRLQPLRREIVPPSIADDAPVGQKAFVFRLRQRQPFDLANQLGLLCLGEKLRLVSIAAGKCLARQWEKIALSHPPYMGTHTEVASGWKGRRVWALGAVARCQAPGGRADYLSSTMTALSRPETSCSEWLRLRGLNRISPG